METIDDKYSANELTNYKSGVNLGYSMESWNMNPRVIETINSIVRQNPHSAFCRGVNKGLERAVLEQDKEQNDQFDSRMSELNKP